MKKLTPDDLNDPARFELLAEIEHRQIKRFILEQINPSLRIVRIYSAYQVIMILTLIFLITKAVISYSRGLSGPVQQITYAVVFSFTALVIIHELLHALAYRICGARRLKAGAVWKKFVFYVMADKEVIGFKAFRIVAYAPLVVVKLTCLLLGVLYWYTPYAYFFFSIMCIHSLFCAGDMAMLAFYRAHTGREIYSYDDPARGKSFFYARKEEGATNRDE